MTTRIVVVRHGETGWNLESRIQGHRDSPLTPAGLAQAEAIATRLAAERFDLLVSSDLGRAMATAARVAARTAHGIVPDARFRERSYGVAEGLTYGELDHQFPDAFSSVRATDPDYIVPGGESRRQFFERVRDGFEALARAHAGATVVVVCHGGVLASLYRLVHSIPIATAQRIPIPNASYNALRHCGEEWIVEAWGDTAHLANAPAFESS